MTKITPRKAIRLFCNQCVSGNIDLCASPNCSLFPYKRARTLKNPKLSPLKAIKAQCYECTGYQYLETKNCTDKNCHLYPFRIGKFPSRGHGKGRSAEHMKRIRPKKSELKSLPLNAF